MKYFTVAFLVLTLLAGCTTLKRATGQIDDTILPGQRQEILPSDQQVLRDPNVVGPQPLLPPEMQSQKPAMNSGLASAAPGGTSCDPKVDYCAHSNAPADATMPTTTKPAVKKKMKFRKKPVKPVSPPAAETFPVPTIPTAPQSPAQ